MKKFKNRHKGERVFIIGNGPSLSNTPLEDMTDEYTIAMNKINLIYDEISWRPSYYLFYDAAHFPDGGLPDHLLRNVKENINQGLTSFISEPGKKYLDDNDNIFYYDYDHTNYRERRKKAIETGEISDVWYRDITNGIYNCGSTVSVAAQIASYMGFDEIYFVGCDLWKPSPVIDIRKGLDEYEFESDSNIKKFLEYISDSSTPIQSAFDLCKYKLYEDFYSRDHKNNTHFSDNYRKRGPFKTDKKYLKFEEVHKIIKLASEKYDFNMYNATVGGYLNIYERVDINNILNISTPQPV